jgi:hypothetical protein
MKIKICALLMAFVFAGSLYAQDSGDALRLSEPGFLSGARALGMGNATSTIGNDFSSIYFNPAGLGLYKNSELIISGYNNNFSNNALYYGNSLKNSLDATNFSQIGLVYKMPVSRGSLVFAIGYNRTKDFNRVLQFSGYNHGSTSMIQDLTSKHSDFTYLAGVSFPVDSLTDNTRINGRLQQEGKISDDGGLDNWSFAFSTELQKDLFVGATVNVINGSFKRDSEYYETDVNSVYGSILLDPADTRTSAFQKFSYFTSVDWDISGWDAQLGFVYKIRNKGAIGASIRFPRTFTIKETYSLSSIGDFAAHTFNVEPASSVYEYEIKTPYEFTFGGSYNFNRILLSADFKYIDYTQMEFTEGLTLADRSIINSEIKSLYRGVLNSNFGAELDLPEIGIKLRGGFMMMKSPYKDDPSDYDKKFVTAGIGVPLDQLEFDLGFSYGWWKDYKYLYESAYSPVYQDIKSTTFMVSMKYRIF